MLVNILYCNILYSFYFANISFCSSRVEVELPTVERLWGPVVVNYWHVTLVLEHPEGLHLPRRDLDWLLEEDPPDCFVACWGGQRAGVVDKLRVRQRKEVLHLEGGVDHVELGIKVFDVCKTFNEGGQQFVVLIADLEHLADNGKTIGRGKSFLHGEANLGMDDVHLHGELLPVDRVLRTPGVVSAPVEMQLQHLITLTLTENIRRSSHDTITFVLVDNTKLSSVAIVGHFSIEPRVFSKLLISIFKRCTEPFISFKIELTGLSVCQSVLRPLHVDWRLALPSAILKACFPELGST